MPGPVSFRRGARLRANEHGKPFSSVTDTLNPFNPDELRRLARVVEEYGLSELRYQSGGLRILLRTAEAAPASPRSVPVAPPPPADFALPSDAHFADDFSGAPPFPTNTAEETAAGTPIEAPVMGVFYRAAAPGEPPLVEVGDTVEAGQPVGLIEAMKVFSEVLSETAGTVRAIPARNGALVQPGDVLLLIEASEAA